MISEKLAMRRLEQIFGRKEYYAPTEALITAENNGMRIVLANTDGRILLVDPHSSTHYIFEPTGPLSEYSTKTTVDEIEIAEPLPERYVRPEFAGWEPVDPDWRSLVRSGDLRDKAHLVGVMSI